MSATLRNEPHLSTLADGTIWSGDFKPSMHQRVHIKMNNLGEGRICDFFTEAGYKGVIVKLDNAPKWHRLQFPEGHEAHNKAWCFGIELELLDPRS